MRILMLMLLLSLAACEKAPPPEPKEEPLATRPAKADPDDWCVGHDVPESMCTKCHKDLIERYKAAGDYCEEHKFPESVCPICNPLAAPAGTEGKADEHGSEEHGATDRHGHGDGPFPKGTVVRLAKPEHVAVAGIQTVVAHQSAVGLNVRAPATVQFDQDAVAEVRAPVRGIVRDVIADLGAKVEAGDPLFVLASAEVGDLQAGLRAAREEAETASSNHDRQARLAKDGIASARKVELARQQAQSAQARLASMKSSLRLAGAAGKGGEFVVSAPIAGSVVRRPAVLGSAADPDTSLATIADNEKMWALIDVAERDAAMLAIGQPVTLEVEGLDEPSAGSIAWVSPEIDPRTRTVAVRAVIDNAAKKLRANQFAHAMIGVSPSENAVVVPVDALQRVDDASVVFVEKSKGLYEPRVVTIGHRTEGDIEIRDGVENGERVVTHGSFLLRTELSRDSIGAGCCEVEVAESGTN